MYQDYLMANQGFGPVGSAISGLDPGLRRPFRNERNIPCVTLNTGNWVKDEKTKKLRPERKTYTFQQLNRMGIQSPVINATSLSKDAWIEMDNVVQEVATKRLSAWRDAARVSTVRISAGLGKTTYEYQQRSQAGEALVDMDGLSEGRNDAPLLTINSIPIPITHSDFYMSIRERETSKLSLMRLDTTMAQECAERVAEMLEKTLIGTETGLTYGTRSTGQFAVRGTSTVYGYTNVPERLTMNTLTIPLGSNPEATLANVITMRERMYAQNHYGPFMIYHSTDWDAFLDNDYFRAGGTSVTRTLRERLEAVSGIAGLRRLDYLTSTTNPWTMVMVEMKPQTVQIINALDITTLQWESQGGMRINFKIMCAQVPLVRRGDYINQIGVLHATTP